MFVLFSAFVSRSEDLFSFYGLRAPRIRRISPRTGSGKHFHCVSATSFQSENPKNVSRRLLGRLLFASVPMLTLVNHVNAEEALTQFREYEDTKDFYRLKFPAGWDCATRPPQGLDFACHAPGFFDENLTTTVQTTKIDTLNDLGTVDDVAQRLVSLYDRPGTNRKATILVATRVVEGDADGEPQEYYQLEYVVESSDWIRRYLSKIAVCNGRVVSATIQCPEEQFEADEDVLRRVIDMFEVYVS
mmetsp:Transcript_7148/g.12201  ORF Transcript_7148/g.12201 Transcript_7148/m.12201 type:complete len:245 (+) Transcript_7148:49-783(+)